MDAAVLVLAVLCLIVVSARRRPRLAYSTIEMIDAALVLARTQRRPIKCGRCGHVLGDHEAIEVAKCRWPGCRCHAFVTVVPR